MKYDIVENNIKIENKIIYCVDKDIISIIHSLEQQNQELKNELKETNESITWWNNRFNVVTRDKKQLKDNWNKLKEITKSRSGLKKQCYNGGLWFEIDDLLDKMQELEGSDK